MLNIPDGYEDMDIQEPCIVTNDTYAFSKEYFDVVKTQLTKNPEAENMFFTIHSIPYTMNKKVDKSEKYIIYTGNFKVNLDELRKEHEDIDSLATAVFNKMFSEFKPFVNIQ